MTVALGGIDCLWTCFAEKACVVCHLTNREPPKSTLQPKLPSKSPLPKELLSLRFQSLIFEFTGSNNPLSL